MSRTARYWLVAGWIAVLLLPWYALEDGLFASGWLTDAWSEDVAPLAVQASRHGRTWLWPILAILALPLLVWRRPKGDAFGTALLIGVGAAGIAWMLLQGFAIGLRGWSWPWLATLAGDLESRQLGMGWGALLAGASFLFLFTEGLAARGALRGDAFVLGVVALVVAGTALFVFYPVALVLVGGGKTDDGYSIIAFGGRLVSSDIWSLGCVAGARCGTFWKTLLLALVVATTTTMLGTAFALLAARMSFRFQRLLRLFALLPIITPPFVVGLAIILLVGRTGAVTTFLDWAFGIPPTRWIYGFSGMAFAQTLSFTPIAFLIMVGVVQGISPSMEEAAQTLRASPARVFSTVTMPLMRPGLANAFLVGMLESFADFGNPIVLAGNYDVLSIQIYFALVGSQNDPGRAAALAIVLLAMALAVFVAQALWLGNRSYTTVAGKGDSGLHAPLPRTVRTGVYWTTLPWVALTAVIYGTVIFGGFVANVGRDHSFTLGHFVEMFGVSSGAGGLVWSGGAWKSFFTTMETALIAAPLTAAFGLLIAYVLVRQRFAGKGAFEFVTMLSFAIPGTVIGLSYVMAFNTPPVEITGTTIILIVCFVFRDMPVGIRAGVAALSQIDPSLDESSLTLRHGGFATLRRVIVPLIRPAIVAALVFGLVRAMTSLSAVVFIATTRHNLATNYIVGRLEFADYGGAIAYSAVLIAVMAAMIVGIQLLVGERRLGRRVAAS